MSSFSRILEIQFHFSAKKNVDENTFCVCGLWICKGIKKCHAVEYNLHVSLKTRRLLLKWTQYHMLSKGTAFSRNKWTSTTLAKQHIIIYTYNICPGHSCNNTYVTNQNIWCSDSNNSFNYLLFFITPLSCRWKELWNLTQLLPFNCWWGKC